MATGKKALCVGINKFKNFSDHNLQGCVNDANDMAGVLKEFLGFKAADITLLTDTKATKARIMSNLEKMVKDAHAGKLSNLVFSMSSHGTQVPDVGGDEPDRYDEAFCPHDLASTGSAWDPAHVIIDDELRDMFAQLPDGVSLEVWLDTCHSGTGLKAIDMLMDRTPRYIPPPTLEAFFALEGRHPRGLARGLLEKGVTDQVLWAACRADQTSADQFLHREQLLGFTLQEPPGRDPGPGSNHLGDIVRSYFLLDHRFYRLIGFSRGDALYLACLTFAVVAYYISRRALRKLGRK